MIRMGITVNDILFQCQRQPQLCSVTDEMLPNKLFDINTTDIGYLANNTLHKHHLGVLSLQWHHNERDGISNHPQIIHPTVHSSKDQRKHQRNVTGPCEGNSLVTGDFPAQGPVTLKMFPFHDVIVCTFLQQPALINNKVIPKAPHYWPLVKGFHWILKRSSSYHFYHMILVNYATDTPIF